MSFPTQHTRLQKGQGLSSDGADHADREGGAGRADLADAVHRIEVLHRVKAVHHVERPHLIELIPQIRSLRLIRRSPFNLR